LGELEAAVMDRMWSWSGGATVRDVLDDLNRDRPQAYAYTTVMTVMDNLYRKDVLARESVGRAYRYTPVRDRAEHSADLIAAVLTDSGDRTEPLLRFVERMTPAEVARLRAALDGGPPPAPGRGRRGRGTGPR
jgi:predicted transcriptional regulator